jgi:hypothetical protein
MRLSDLEPNHGNTSGWFSKTQRDKKFDPGYWIKFLEPPWSQVNHSGGQCARATDNSKRNHSPSPTSTIIDDPARRQARGSSHLSLRRNAPKTAKNGLKYAIAEKDVTFPRCDDNVTLPKNVTIY